MQGRKKVKYVQKTLYVQKRQKQETQESAFKIQPKVQKQVLFHNNPKYTEKEKNKKTQVVNVKVQFLRKLGYKNLVEWLQDPDHIYIGRQNHYVAGATASIWANPFKVDQYGREGCIQRYKEYILSNQKLMGQISSLKGKALGCWCHPQGCHGDILASLANQANDR